MAIKFIVKNQFTFFGHQAVNQGTTNSPIYVGIQGIGK